MRDPLLISRSGTPFAQSPIVFQFDGRLRNASINIERDAREIVNGEARMKDDTAGDYYPGEDLPPASAQVRAPTIEAVNKCDGKSHIEGMRGGRFDGKGKAHVKEKHGEQRQVFDGPPIFLRMIFGEPPDDHHDGLNDPDRPEKDDERDEPGLLP